MSGTWQEPFADDASEISYRSVSLACVIGFLLGLLSPVALIDPLLWIVPIAGLILSAWGVRKVAAEPSRLTGRNIAVVGIAVSTVILGWAPTRLFVTRHFVYADARKMADQWCALLKAGKREEVYELHQEQQFRRAPSVSLTQYYETNADPRKQLEAYFEREPLKTLVAQAADGQFRFVGNEEQSRVRENGTQVDFVVLRYDFVHQDEVTPLLLTLKRRFVPATGETRWNVEAVAFLE
mgnify:CR=1 FL=1